MVSIFATNILKNMENMNKMLWIMSRYDPTFEFIINIADLWLS